MARSWREVSCQIGRYPKQARIMVRGYGCSGADELAEKSISISRTPLIIVHWPPFLKAAVQHIRETYPNPETDEKAQSLIAFIFAVSAHQVQDAAWHSIGLLMGFMMDVHVVDCHLDYECAHTTLDWGGDAIFSKRYSGLKGASDWAFVRSLMCGFNCRGIGMFQSMIWRLFMDG